MDQNNFISHRNHFLRAEMQLLNSMRKHLSGCLRLYVPEPAGQLWGRQNASAQNYVWSLNVTIISTPGLVKGSTALRAFKEKEVNQQGNHWGPNPGFHICPNYTGSEERKTFFPQMALQPICVLLCMVAECVVSPPGGGYMWEKGRGRWENSWLAAISLFLSSPFSPKHPSAVQKG